MTQIPSDDALLAATIDYLEAQLLPALEGEHRFKTRLAVNALKALQRSQRRLAAEAEQVQNEHWAQRIFYREVALDDPETLAYLESSLRRSLHINNPKWLNN
jgi:hypothetical protein